MNLKEARFIRGKTQEYIEIKTGISQSHLSHVENDKAALSREDQIKIEKVLELPIDWSHTK